MPKGLAIRFRVDPGDVPPEKIARRLHLTLAEFEAKFSELRRRGFPAPDPTTGMFDLEAVNQWRHARNPHLFPLTAQPSATEVSRLVRERLARGTGRD
jgi:hypothetical protein